MKREHGSRAKYVNEKCRCERCRAANADYARAKSGNYPSRQSAARRAAHAAVVAARPPKVPLSPAQRLLVHVDVSDERACWIPNLRPAPTGYVIVATGNGRRLYAHRIMYEHMVGPIPSGLVIDHLCRVRACCNPSHLEPVTDQENIRRGLAPIPLAERESWLRKRADGWHDPDVSHAALWPTGGAA